MNRGQASDAILDSPLPGPQKLILLGYLKHQSSADAPEVGISWPGAKRLAAYAGVCEALAIEHRGVLIASGVLVVALVDEGSNKRCRIDFGAIPTAEQVEALEVARKAKRTHRTRTPLGAADPVGLEEGTPSAATTHPLGAADPSPRSGRPTPSAPPTPPLGGYEDPPRRGRPNPSSEIPPQSTGSMEPSAQNPPQGTGGAQVVANLTGSPPPAEPSGSLSEALSPEPQIPPWLTEPIEDFQPVSEPYTFGDAHHNGIPEQPSNPRQIESPATHRAPEAPPQGFRPSPTRSQGNGEGATGPVQGALWGAGERPGLGEGQGSPPASEASGAPTVGKETGKPKRTRKPAGESPDALAVYAAWRTHHTRAPEAPTPDTLRTLGRILTEAGGLDGALLLMEWVHLGTCERARQLRGEAPWPGGDLTKRWDIESLSRQVAGRLEMARDWKDRSIDKDSGLNVINLPPPAYRGPPNRTTRDVDFYKALALI